MLTRSSDLTELGRVAVAATSHRARLDEGAAEGRVGTRPSRLASPLNLLRINRMNQVFQLAVATAKLATKGGTKPARTESTSSQRAQTCKAYCDLSAFIFHDSYA